MISSDLSLRKTSANKISASNLHDGIWLFFRILSAFLRAEDDIIINLTPSILNFAP